jgi:flagellar biosynthetic protein FliR/FlhB
MLDPKFFTEPHLYQPFLLFYAFILFRALGILFISPLLANKSLTFISRLYLGIFVAFLLALTLYPQYARQTLLLQTPNGYLLDLNNYLGIALTCLEELALGYLLGFCFNIVFEAMVMAGELIDNMIGFSTAQFVNPFSYAFHSSLGMLLMFTGALFMLITDFHHVFIRVLADSFILVPIGHYHLPPNSIKDITDGTSWIYTFAIKYGAISILVLCINLVGVAFTVRVVPEMNLLLTGLPLRVLFGLWSMMLAMGRIFPLFGQTFRQVMRLVESLLLQMSSF